MKIFGIVMAIGLLYILIVHSSIGPVIVPAIDPSITEYDRFSDGVRLIVFGVSGKDLLEITPYGDLSLLDRGTFSIGFRGSENGFISFSKGVLFIQHDEVQKFYNIENRQFNSIPFGDDCGITISVYPEYSNHMEKFITRRW
jgi:hypothetical protein